uniref:Uncharacterized protein n=1 Tax=Paenarthrobacter aurescens TaxID=43663 RepID=Q6SJZ4_PAEAU|nr:hypothetical protein [Paenarthrobacter aurescens]
MSKPSRRRLTRATNVADVLWPDFALARIGCISTRRDDDDGSLNGRVHWPRGAAKRPDALQIAS